MLHYFLYYIVRCFIFSKGGIKMRITNTYGIINSKTDRKMVVDLNNNGRADKNEPSLMMSRIDPVGGSLPPELEDAFAKAEETGKVVLAGDDLKNCFVLTRRKENEDFTPENTKTFDEEFTKIDEDKKIYDKLVDAKLELDQRGKGVLTVEVDRWFLSDQPIK